MQIESREERRGEIREERREDREERRSEKREVRGERIIECKKRDDNQQEERVSMNTTFHFPFNT